jgi:RNA polymerase sigma-70 factor, ECF subfamily
MNSTEDEPDSIDNALIRRIALGDEDAFVTLYRRRQRDVYRFAFAMTKSVSVAQDVTQDVFLEVLETSAGFDSAKGSGRAWLLGCARHAVLDRLRRDRRWSAAAELPDAATAPRSNEDEVLGEQRLRKLHAAIVTLPIEYREALVLCELAELSYADAAVALACPIGTIRSRLHRAKALLAARLADLGAATHDTTEDSALATLLAAKEVCP